MTFDPKIPYKVPALRAYRLKKVQSSLVKELTEANIAIAQIKGFLRGLPQSSVALMNPLFVKEAVESSEIENINTTLLEVMQRQVAPDIESKTGSQLVVNYTLASHWAVRNLERLGLISRLVTGIQHKLVPGGTEGYRRLQVVIGDGRGKVHYTPPLASDIPGLISDWEKLVNGNKEIDPLVIAAVAHYQFEAIHPFEDGNGRTGRMLINLQMVQAGLLDVPVVHISQYINAHKSRYYKLLRETTSEDKLEDFVRFMLKAFTTQANHSFALLQRVQELQFEFKHEIRSKLPNIYSHELLDAIFSRPVQTPVRLAKDTGLHYVTTSKHLKKLEEIGLLTSSKQGKYMYYINDRLLELIEEKGHMKPKKSAVVETVVIDEED
ncbi:MAG: Fic family protein [Candidatus Saccharimonadales bacterium]